MTTTQARPKLAVWKFASCDGCQLTLLMFVVFFALAGASLHISELPVLWPLALPIVAVRLGGIWLGTQLGGRWGGASAAERRYVWMGLVSQAGVAIGLATVLAEVYPERGAEIRTLFLTVIAVNESIGPIFFRHALSASGEIAERRGTDWGRRADRRSQGMSVAGRPDG